MYWCNLIVHNIMYPLIVPRFTDKLRIFLQTCMFKKTAHIHCNERLRILFFVDVCSAAGGMSPEGIQ